jgi:adenosylhomocysteine nucleosidase
MAPTIAKLGIMTAMQEEFRLIAGAFGFTTSQDIGPRTFLSATHNDLELTLVAARVGKVAAAVTASLLIQEFGVDAIVVVGVAGATDSTVRIGDIVVADRLVQHDIDLKGVLGYQRFDIPLLDVREMRSCERLFATATEAAKLAAESPAYTNGIRSFSQEQPRVHAGVIGSGDVFVCDPGERDSLSAAISDLKCVEMEGAAVAQVCVEHEVPFVVTRIISDEASGHAAGDFGAFIEQAASVGSAAFVREFVSVLASGE